MTNHRKFSKEKQFQITESLEHFKQLFMNYTPTEIEGHLYELFRYSLTCDDRDGMTTAELKESFFFYESLKELITGAQMLNGLKA